MNDFCANDVDRFKMIHGLVFEIDATLDASLTELVRKMLPLASDYMLVEAFVETYSAYEYGRVNNALAAAIRELLKEYLILIAQLEHQVRTRSTEFGLSKLWFYLQSTMNTMSSLAGLVRVVMRQTSTSAASGASHHYNQHYRICKGGNLLNILAERMVSLSG